MSIMTCTCDSPMQDAIHGKGMRLFNPRADGVRFRCTVCRREVNTGGAPSKAAKKAAKK